MIVCKFGGTSVADAPAIRRLAGIIAERAAERPLVVVSALARVTDGLLAVARDRADGLTGGGVDRLEALVRRHAELVAELGLAPAVLAPIREEAEVLGRALVELADDTPSPAFLDFVAGHGELWSSRIVAAALQASGLSSEWVDIRPVMRTDVRFMAAQPEREGLSARAALVFAPLLAAGTVPVTQGFIGSTGDGTPTTLGRGGSDFTATLLGAALQAARVEIWTDVDGIMTADPRIVPEARVLPVASHHEAAELAAFGARVLHPATQAPLVEAGIPCVVLNSFAPDRPGTTVVVGARPEPLGESPVRAISCKRGITVFNIRSPRMLGATGFLRRLFEVFERHDVSVDVLATSEVSISVTVDEPAPLATLIPALQKLGEVTVHPGRAIIAVVGIDLRGTCGIAGRVFSAVRDINVEVISQGASAINLTFVVREDQAHDTVRRLHHEFFQPVEAT